MSSDKPTRQQIDRLWTIWKPKFDPELVKAIDALATPPPPPVPVPPSPELLESLVDLFEVGAEAGRKKLERELAAEKRKGCTWQIAQKTIEPHVLRTGWPAGGIRDLCRVVLDKTGQKCHRYVMRRAVRESPLLANARRGENYIGMGRLIENMGAVANQEMLDRLWPRMSTNERAAFERMSKEDQLDLLRLLKSDPGA